MLSFEKRKWGRGRGNDPDNFPSLKIFLLYILDRRYFRRYDLMDLLSGNHCEQYIIAESNNWATNAVLVSLAFSEIHIPGSILCEKSWKKKVILIILYGIILTLNLIAIKCTLGESVCPLFIKMRAIRLFQAYYIVSVSICVCACMYVYVQLQPLASSSLPLSIVHSISAQFLPPSRARVDFKRHSRKRNDSCQIFNGT